MNQDLNACIQDWQRHQTLIEQQKQRLFERRIQEAGHKLKTLVETGTRMNLPLFQAPPATPLTHLAPHHNPTPNTQSIAH